MTSTNVSTSGRLLGIFAKQPVAGQVKTRLAQATSAEWAKQVAEAFLEDSLDRLLSVSTERVIAYAPTSASDYFARRVAHGYDLFAQGEGDLGVRLQLFFRHHQKQGFTRIVVVGADSPTLPIAYIDQAFEALDHCDVAIGPASDGGYYLLGCGRTELPLFEGIPWSTANVLEATIQRLQQTDARLTLLPPWYDVDTVLDWSMLRGHVLAMRRAGLDPGVPRIERLMREQSG